MPVTDRTDWPLPSESRRVRMLLYFAEGLIAGSILYIGTAFAASRGAMFSGEFEVWSIVILVGFAIWGAQWAAGILLVEHTSDAPSRYQDWKTVRQWQWVVAIAIPLIAVLYGSIVLLGQGETGLLSRDAEWIVTAGLVSGLVLHMVILRPNNHVNREISQSDQSEYGISLSILIGFAGVLGSVIAGFYWLGVPVGVIELIVIVYLWLAVLIFTALYGL